MTTMFNAENRTLKKLTWFFVCEEFVITNENFTGMCLVAWPMNESEAGCNFIFIETLLVFLSKLLLISMRAAGGWR